jgi:hypothetical protein
VLLDQLDKPFLLLGIGLALNSFEILGFVAMRDEFRWRKQRLMLSAGDEKTFGM